MATTLAPPPAPPPPAVSRFDGQGRPTVAQVEYEQRMQAWLRLLAAVAQGS